MTVVILHCKECGKECVPHCLVNKRCEWIKCPTHGVRRVPEQVK